MAVIGTGNAKVMGANGELVGLGNVLLVEGLSANLLSVRKLQKSRARVTFGPSYCEAKLGSKLLWNLEEKTSCLKNLWQLPAIPCGGMKPEAERAAVHGVSTSKGETQGTKKVLVKPKDEMLGGVGAAAAWAKASRRGGEADWETWHERLGHVNFPMLQRLVKSGSIKGVKVKGPIKDEGSCPTCLECKFSKFPFEKARGGRREPLAFVHMDVVDPRYGPSLDGCHYFLTIVDDFTRAVWAYPLKNKGDVPGVVLEEWLPRAQRESGHKVKAVAICFACS